VSTLKKYAERVCGGIPAVKRMFVDELRRKRLAKNLSPGEVDRLVGLGSEWPTVREMEEDPNLFSFRFYQEVAWLIMNNPAAAEKLFDLSGEDMNIPIGQFLENQANIEEALSDFKPGVRFLHGTLYGSDPDEYGRKVVQGEPVKQFEPNMIPPCVYASIHIYGCIMHELAELDPKPIT
jgi:hypothetical protein